MLDAEMEYLTKNIESVVLSHRVQSRSLMCVFKKKAI
jgi:hypothetical protein